MKYLYKLTLVTTDDETKISYKMLTIAEYYELDKSLAYDKQIQSIKDYEVKKFTDEELYELKLINFINEISVKEAIDIISSLAGR